ncbi:hypothetical protein EV643_112268 [Kribbella sp. VKM Ac-2527]|uniref:Uncharacterized protein n=1 Tax=Kribbella caucasensis TaxID=2512215 RepID=A0A4V3C9K0_9ACTN|nr:hypothetical protein [Kribbella sp. VKM Ac-2527]TDO45938.1 hypothetical protein EV643_112268 [Kribbella sp. VKM Ac-2527]
MRKRNWLLGLGLAAAAAWSVAVSAAMPSWFDPSDDCAHTAGRSGFSYPSGSSERSIDIEISWFPPRATCDVGGDRVYDFISPAKSVTLTVIGVLIALVVAVGLVGAVRKLFSTGGVIRSPEAIDLRRRRFTHLATAAAAGFVAIGGCVLALVFAVFLGGPPGVITLAIAAPVVFAALASAIDRAYGPLPSTAAHSRRRGTAAAVITLLVAVLAAARNFPIPTFWPALLGAATYAIVVAVQWTRPVRLQVPQQFSLAPPPAPGRIRTDRQDDVDQETGRHA